MKYIKVIFGSVTIVAGLFFFKRKMLGNRLQTSGMKQNIDPYDHDSLAAHHWLS